VELASQLHYKAQKHADGIFGFNAGHVDVLYYLRTCNRFEQILNQEINKRRAQGLKASDLGIPE